MNFDTKLNRISYNGDKKDRGKESKERKREREALTHDREIEQKSMTFCDITCE